MSESLSTALAGIQYMGIAGVSADCKDAVMRLVQFGDRVTKARIISSDGTHCLILTINVGDIVAIKSGFASGYGGEGPAALSFVLALLGAHGADIDEIDAPEELIERLDMSALTGRDLEFIENTRKVSPRRINDYLTERDWQRAKSGETWEEFPPVMPFAIIDSRIADLALDFWESPDERLLTGWRRLEDIVRKRLDSNEHGAKLFSSAFLGGKAALRWRRISASEQVGRANLFTASYSAYRNPRAHKEMTHDRTLQLGEFLLINHLYCLERTAVDKLSDADG